MDQGIAEDHLRPPGLFEEFSLCKSLPVAILGFGPIPMLDTLYQ